MRLQNFFVIFYSEAFLMESCNKMAFIFFLSRDGKFLIYNFFERKLASVQSGLILLLYHIFHFKVNYENTQRYENLHKSINFSSMTYEISQCMCSIPSNKKKIFNNSVCRSIKGKIELLFRNPCPSRAI